MYANSIENLQELVFDFVPSHWKFIGGAFRKLTSSGDNYGSVLLGVDVTVQDCNTGEQHYVYAVAKKLPKNELVQKMFNSQQTFPNEVAFYEKIAPCLQKLNPSISFFPQFYAARVNNSCGRIEENSVLLIQNIKKEGFDILDRTIGFTLCQSHIILEKMAELHASVIALKEKNPDAFAHYLEPFFEEYQTFVMDEENNRKMIKAALDVIADDEICGRFFSELEQVMHKSSLLYPSKNTGVESSFCTFVHSDLWTNNIMVKMSDGVLEDVKFVDYQLYEYTSLTRDVVFFIYSSVRLEVLEHSCDDLLVHYYKSFIDCLKRLKADCSQFSYHAFLGDMQDMVKKYEFFHIMTMLPPIYATPKDTKDVEQLEMDSFVFDGTEVTEQYKNKASFIVRDLLKRGWLP